MMALTMKAKMRKMSYHAFRTLQRPPLSQKIFLECFLTVQLSTGRLKCGTTLNFVFVHVQFHPNHGGKKYIVIDDDHGCKATAMTPQELLKHLTNQVDYTHTTISIYLQTLSTFSWGHVRQDPGVNSKKKSDSDEEEKEEEEREEEEEEVAAALDNNDVYCEQVDTYACDHSKQGLETQITSETHKDPVSEVTDGCESAKMYWMT